MSIGKANQIWVLGFLCIIVIASLSLLYFQRVAVTVVAPASGAEKKISQAGSSAIIGSDSANAAIKESSTPVATKQSIIAELATKDKQSWLRALRQYFPTVDLTEAWDVLTAPGVVDQFAAKAIREQIVDACRIRPKDAKSGLVHDRCASLRQMYSQEYFFQEYEKNQADQDYWLSDARLRGELPEKLTPNDLAVDRAIAQQQAFQTDDPWLAASGVSHLIALRSPLILSDWSQTEGLTQDQLGYVLDTISVDRACQVIGGCDATSFFTLQYCYNDVLVCPAGANFEEIVQLNLNQVQLALRQKILDNLARVQH